MDTEFDLYDYDRFALYDPKLFGFEEIISDEHFNLYYTIDRKLFYRLIRKLGRNVDESMHVVAFLIWLERICYSHNAVYKVTAWPFNLVDQLANQIATFLMFLESEMLCMQYIDLYLLRKLCSRNINMFYFHEKRIRILESVTKIVSEICKRAFKDILTADSEFVDVEGDQLWYGYNNPVFRSPPFNPNVTLGFPLVRFRGTSDSKNYLPPNYQLGNILEDPNADLSEIFGGMHLVNGCEDEPDVDRDDRTIFLTFSKGYYIPELEIREFFTRIFGEFIEEINIQDVSSDEQPLYARMVCRSSSIIPKIAPPGKKSKYSINGKHIWAKKYEKRSRASATATS